MLKYKKYLIRKGEMVLKNKIFLIYSLLVLLVITNGILFSEEKSPGGLAEHIQVLDYKSKFEDLKFTFYKNLGFDFKVEFFLPNFIWIDQEYFNIIPITVISDKDSLFSPEKLLITQGKLTVNPAMVRIEQKDIKKINKNEEANYLLILTPKIDLSEKVTISYKDKSTEIIFKEKKE